MLNCEYSYIFIFRVLKTDTFFSFIFLAVLGLHCSEQRLLFVAVRGLLIAVASLVMKHGL